MTDRNQTYQKERVSTHSDVQCGSANRQTSFLGRGNARIKLPFSGHIANKFRRPTILQLNIEASLQARSTFFITSLSTAVWGTRHPTAEDPLHWCREVGTTKLPTSWVVFKQEAWPCHVCPRATEIHAFGPISTDIGDRVVVCGRWWL